MKRHFSRHLFYSLACLDLYNHFRWKINLMWYKRYFIYIWSKLYFEVITWLKYLSLPFFLLLFNYVKEHHICFINFISKLVEKFVSLPSSASCLSTVSALYIILRCVGCAMVNSTLFSVSLGFHYISPLVLCLHEYDNLRKCP